MKEKENLQRIAYLESRLDHIESELGYVNHLLISCGFQEGIQSLKSTIEELLQEAENQ